MRFSVITVLAAATAVTAQSSTVTPAPEVTSNPVGAKYVGTLPQKAGSALSGSIEATTGADGKGVNFAVSIAGLPETGGPFMYHIHAKPVPTDGNCTGTGAHLDPYNRGEAPPCDASRPETCQVGDLSGKHGNITERSLSTEYSDAFLSTNPADPSFFGHLSFVVHLSNKTRIGCANFSIIGGASGATSSGYAALPSTTASSGFAHPSGSSVYNSTTVVATSTATIGQPIAPSSASASAPPQFTNAAAKVAGSAGVLLAAAAALVL